MKKNLRVCNDSAVDKWLEDDGLMLLECYTRDGYTLGEIANKIGVTYKSLKEWKTIYPEIDKALSKGKELVDYEVENALLKTALGYKKKEVKVTTLLRYGKVVETTKEVTETEQAPNVTAIQTWLYNRQKEKWRNMNSKSNMFEDMVEDETIEVIVRRANPNETGEDEGIEEKDIVLRKRSEEEQEKIKKQKKAEEAKQRRKEKQHTEVIKENEDEEDVDEWQEDWEDEDE